MSTREARGAARSASLTAAGCPNIKVQRHSSSGPISGEPTRRTSRGPFDERTRDRAASAASRAAGGVPRRRRRG